MDTLTLLAHTLRLSFNACRAVRVPKAVAMSRSERAGSAHGLVYAILASMWQRRCHAESWCSIHRDWERRLEKSAGIDSSLYGFFAPADDFELLTDNAAAFERRDRLYASAKRSIDISTYYIQADETGWKTAHALADCAHRGVRVRIIADRSMTGRKIFENPEVREVIRFVRQAGIEYRLFRDGRRPYDACHRKLLIVDSAVLITGGRNYADHYARDGWRDIEIQLTGPSVACAQRIYEDTFNSAQETGAHRRAASIFQMTDPAGIRDNSAFLYLLASIRACRETLDIENAYYFNHEIVLRYLADARRRGVRIRLFTNSDESNDLDFLNYRLYCGFPELLDCGVSLYLRRGKGKTLHSKYFVADGEWVAFGSSNLDFYSPRFCLEAGIHTRNRRLGGLLTNWFEQGIADSERLTDATTARAIAERQTIGRIIDRWCPDLQ